MVKSEINIISVLFYLIFVMAVCVGLSLLVKSCFDKCMEYYYKKRNNIRKTHEEYFEI